VAGNEQITALLYQLYTDQEFYYMNNYNNPVVIEAEEMGLIYHKGNRYALTKEGLILIKSERDYDDFLRERLPIKTPQKADKNTQINTNQAGTSVFRRLCKKCIVLLNNEWIKGVLISVIAALIVAVIIYYSWMTKR